MRAYNFIPAIYAIDDLKKRHIKISRLQDLNDPFELLSLELSDSKLRHMFGKMKARLNSEHGIICFSKSWSNPVLWSHYADKHRGICLGIDIPDESVVHVSYNTKRLSQDIYKVLQKGTIDEKRGFMIRLLSTKFKAWEYEDEVRIFPYLKTEEAGNYFQEFSESFVLREVILGARCNETISEVRDILQSYKHEVTLIQSRLAFKSFKIVENKFKTRTIQSTH